MVDQVLVRWSGSVVPDSWEDHDELRTRFPYAAAWGQAATKEEGGVNTATPGGPLTQEVAQPQREASKQVRKPNPRVTGDSWVQ